MIFASVTRQQLEQALEKQTHYKYTLYRLITKNKSIVILLIIILLLISNFIKVTDPSEKSTIVLPRNGFGGSLACVLQKYEIKTWGHGCLVSGIAV